MDAYRLIQQPGMPFRFILRTDPKATYFVSDARPYVIRLP